MKPTFCSDTNSSGTCTATLEIIPPRRPFSSVPTKYILLLVCHSPSYVEEGPNAEAQCSYVALSSKPNMARYTFRAGALISILNWSRSIFFFFKGGRLGIDTHAVYR